MTKVSKNRMNLRILYTRETNIIFSDDIPKYADWLEISLANLLEELEHAAIINQIKPAT
jgi:hypothetical protein